ncbi:hypothetical protein [Tsukamurella strandjordii]|uniref:Uncharacterized protein n=1 Tax=Tsukamurella strandjordii TaxID=147577 RepID=A0AA90NQM3_9ACTN|nr:hypothetical protein [Tsukamurella strandjordii]MDP0398914.1 hypothetical protein [Tsukamurella strandjordii]
MNDQNHQPWHGTPANDPSRPRAEFDPNLGEWGWWEPDPDDAESEVWTRALKQEPPTTPEAAAKWDAMLEANDAARCVARKKNGERCRRLAVQAATVCLVHGGAAEHVKRAARARLENAADRMAKELLKIAVSDDAPEGVKLAAIKDALDRAGLGAKTAVEVEVGPTKPWEQIMLAGIAGGPRPAELAPAPTGNNLVPEEFAAHAAMMDEDMGVLDAEVVEGYDAGRALNPRDAHGDADRPRYNASDTASRSYGAVAGELTTAEHAVEEVARINRTAPAARPKHE